MQVKSDILNEKIVEDKLSSKESLDEKIVEEDNITWDFVAGFMQGDGHCGIRINKKIADKEKTFYAPMSYVIFSNSDEQFIQSLFNFLKKEGIRVRKFEHKRKRISYNIEIYHRESVQKILENIVNKLSSHKKKQVEIILYKFLPLKPKGIWGWNKERLRKAIELKGQISMLYDKGRWNAIHTIDYFERKGLI